MIQRIHLEILQALHEKGTLSEAANALFLTQSALSHSIKKLEDQLNTPLWEKQGRGLRLTQAGEHLLRVSQSLLPQLEQAEATLRAYGEGRRGRLRIGMECHPCYEWLLTVVQLYLQRWPEVDLDVIQRFRFNGLEALEQHQIDVLITSDPVLKDHLHHVPVFNYELRLVVPDQHALAAERTVTPNQLCREHLITFPVARERLDVFTQFLLPAGLEPRAHQEIEAMDIMIQLVAANRGVCTLPDWLAKRYQQEYPIKHLQLGDEGVAKTLYLVYRAADAGIDYLADFVQAPS
ncbi:LysR family transcriptional regulator [Salinispirillum sp. LH 10-3-1]|uniref:HTH-type transcriptional regulator MetR n=1 Tax=Salinispirillum sp. LH 10-3-1 TaxID=2952525 RepID=A0AB38YJ14_9GAMM